MYVTPSSPQATTPPQQGGREGGSSLVSHWWVHSVTLSPPSLSHATLYTQPARVQSGAQMVPYRYSLPSLRHPQIMLLLSSLPGDEAQCMIVLIYVQVYASYSITSSRFHCQILFL